jgi:hypothetical protein
MTSKQEIEWNAKACMSKALIAAAASKGINYTEDSFCIQYETAFPDPKAYGGLILSRFYNIACNMGLADDMDLIWDYKTLDELVNKEGHLAFVFSGIHLDQGRNDPFSHVSFLRGIDGFGFTPDGCPQLPTSDWVAKRCCGIVFFKF